MQEAYVSPSKYILRSYDIQKMFKVECARCLAFFLFVTMTHFVAADLLELENLKLAVVAVMVTQGKIDCIGGKTSFCDIRAITGEQPSLKRLCDSPCAWGSNDSQVNYYYLLCAAPRSRGIRSSKSGSRQAFKRKIWRLCSVKVSADQCKFRASLGRIRCCGLGDLNLATAVVCDLASFMQ